MTSYYPVFLNLSDQQVLLIGGGTVAFRKARALVRAGARVLAVSRDFSKAFLRFAKRHGVQIRYGSMLPKTLNGICLVIAATSDRELNHQIYERCKEKNIFVNVVDDPKHCTFIAPSILRRGPLQIAISTGGASPLLAKKLRQKLTEQFGSEYGELVRALQKDRRRAKRSISSAKDRRNHFQKMVASKLKVLERKHSR